MKKALISGVTGQDGSYLAELLLNKGYEVAGIVRISSLLNLLNLRTALASPNFKLYYGDLTDSASINTIMAHVRPDEVYNLGALTHVGLSFQHPERYQDVIAGGTLKMLEATKTYVPQAKFYQASTSELFGNEKAPQNEKTPFSPVSPYGVAKLAAHKHCVNYREAYGMFVSCGILFNHESPRRGDNFVTKKIVKHMAQIKNGQREFIEMGNMLSKRDWGYAPDFVEGMWKMLQHDKPDDFVLATGETHTVQEFFNEVAKQFGLDPKEIHKTNPELMRVNEVNVLKGDARKARKILGWKPKTKFKDLVKIMVESENVI